MTMIIHVDRFGLALLFCVFLSCWGPIDSAGDATRFIGAQSTWVQEHASIVADGSGFDAVMVLRGKNQGNLCSAVVNDFPDLIPPLCAGQNGNTRSPDGTVIHAPQM